MEILHNLVRMLSSLVQPWALTFITWVPLRKIMTSCQLTSRLVGASRRVVGRSCPVSTLPCCPEFEPEVCTAAATPALYHMSTVESGCSLEKCTKYSVL